MRYRKIGIRDVGLETFINTNYPDRGYDLLVTLIESSVSATNIGRVFHSRSPNSVREWIKVFNEERGIKVASSL